MVSYQWGKWFQTVLIIYQNSLNDLSWKIILNYRMMILRESVHKLLQRIFQTVLNGVRIINFDMMYFISIFIMYMRYLAVNHYRRADSDDRNVFTG